MDQCSFSSMKGYSYTFHTLINITLSLDMVRIDNQILQKRFFCNKSHCSKNILDCCNND